MMEDYILDVKDDHNHNYCASVSARARAGSSPVQPVGPRGETPGSADGTGPGGCGAPDTDRSEEQKPSAGSPSRFLLNATAVEDYRRNHWPNLEKAIDRLLVYSPTDHISVSYAQIYSYVYKCVCQQHSELLYNDLIFKVTARLQQVSTHLEVSPAGSIIEDFNDALTQYTTSLQCIVPVFMYLNKFYVESKLNRDLRKDLMKLFADHVADKHVNTLMPLLVKAHSMPFQVQPSTMASVVKGLYSLRPEWAKLAPALFSRFIPQIDPPAVESRLSDYAAHDKKLQLELSMNGFPRGDQSLKRSSNDS